MKLKNIFTIALLITVIILGFWGCVQKGTREIELMAAGATFPYPLYTRMFEVYNGETGVKVNYQGIGSGGGINQLINKTVDFAGTDAFLNDNRIKEAGAHVLHVPICLGAVVVSYNLPNNPEIKFTSEIIADIFLGKIKKWNDAKIKKLNSELDLPNFEISVIHRSDGSGTTSIFSDYLSKVSPEWEKKVGTGTSLNWPVGLGGKGNPGVAGLIKQTPGAVGYVELIYSLQNNLPTGIIQNSKGNFIKPNLESTSLSADVVIPDDTRASLTNTENAKGYPITGFTWIILYQDLGDLNDINQAKEIAKLLNWMVTSGQKYASELHYAPLSDSTVKKAKNIIGSLQFNGKKL